MIACSGRGLWELVLRYTPSLHSSIVYACCGPFKYANICSGWSCDQRFSETLSHYNVTLTRALRACRECRNRWRTAKGQTLRPMITLKVSKPTNLLFEMIWYKFDYWYFELLHEPILDWPTCHAMIWWCTSWIPWNLSFRYILFHEKSHFLILAGSVFYLIWLGR